MSEQKQSIYVGNGKEINGRENAGFKVSINLNQLWDALKTEEGKKATFKSDASGYTYVDLVMWPLKPENVDDRRTHSIKLDTWQPDPNREKAKEEREAEKTVPNSEADDDLPF